LLREHGYASLYDYEKARAGGASLHPLPTLLIVVDEFSELLASKRGVHDLFVQIGRLGRSLGVQFAAGVAAVGRGGVFIGWRGICRTGSHCARFLRWNRAV